MLNSDLSGISSRERGRLGSFIIADSVFSGDQQAPYTNIYTKFAPDFSDLSAAVKNSISYGLTGFGGVNIDIPAKDLTDPKLFDSRAHLSSWKMQLNLIRSKHSLPSGQPLLLTSIQAFVKT